MDSVEISTKHVLVKNICHALKDNNAIVPCGDHIFYKIEAKKIKSGNINYVGTRQTILTTMNLTSNTKIIQIVGDCETYSVEGTKKARSVLVNILNQDGILIEYGLTGYKDGNACDVNYLVSSIIDKYNIPSIANIVDYHTVVAIEKWKCQISNKCRNFLLVFNSDHTVKFGDDIQLSDTLCDTTICLEGGAQSFSQCVNSLLQNKKIVMLYGLRDLKKESYTRYFSCSEFLNQFIGITEESVEKVKDKYMESVILFNPKKGDANEKQGLFDNAWNKFVEYKLRSRVDDLVKFIY